VLNRSSFHSIGSARPLAHAIAAALALYGSAATAATIVVNVDTDTQNVGECSLRDAIIAARDNVAANDCAAGTANDTITFNLTLPASIALATSLPQLGDPMAAAGQQLVVQGPGAANLEIVVGDFMSGLNSFSNSPALTVDGVTLRAFGNIAVFDGISVEGADLTVNNSTITGPFFTGIVKGSSGVFVLENSTVTGVRFEGVRTRGPAPAPNPVTIRNSTFIGNGLGVEVRGVFGSASVVAIENSTFHANTGLGVAAADIRALGYGGALSLNLRNTTLSGDTPSRRVVLDISNGGSVNAFVDSSLFSGPSGSTDIDVEAGLPGRAKGAKGLTPTLTANNSLFSEPQIGIPETTPGTGNQFGVSNPGLDVLANNGGPTQTLALLAGSPAIDTGSNPAALTTDQRGTGFPRTLGAGTDVGAFEFTPPQNVQVFDLANTLQIADDDVTPDAADGTDFGTSPIGTPVVRTYTIRNTGGAPLAISGITSDAGTFVVSGTPASVAAGGTATFTVTFTPTASGAANATITLASDDPDLADASYAFAVQGNGQALQNVQVFDPANTLQIVDGDVTPAVADGTDFGSATIGTPVARTYTIRNTGDLPLSITGITSNAGPFVVSNVPGTVAAGGTATFTVNFTAAAAGAANATITVASNDPDAADASYTFAVQGAGQALQNVQVFDPGNTLQIADGDITPAAADGTDFGATPVGTPVARTYTIRNTGSVPLTIGAISSSAGTFAVSNIPASVVAGGTATFTVTYNAAAAGAANATITVSSNDPDVADSSYTFAVTGSAFSVQNVQVFDPGNTVQIADGDITPAAADGTDFGATPVGTPVVRTYTIRNTGTVPLTIGAISSSAGTFAVSNIPASVAAGGTATFTVTYNAAAAGAANATITVSSNDPDVADSSYTFAVTGSAFSVQNVQVFDPGNTVQIADGDATPSTGDGTDFGTTIVGTPVVRTYTIRNSGTQPLSISSITSSSASFTVSGAPASVAGGATATFTVTLAAGAVGPASGTITVASNDPDAADASYTFAVQGTVAGARDIDVFDASGVTPIVDGDTTPSTLEGTDFGSITVGSNAARSFMIRNSGSQPLALTSILSGNPSFVLGAVPASVPAGSSITFTVTFNATTPGTSTATLTIVSDDPDASETQWTFTLQGVAIAPGSVVTPTVIPTLSGWAMTLLAAMLAALGWRRRESVRVKPRA